MGASKHKIKTIDLFAGCGGLMEGFEKTGHYETLACVEWEKSPCDNLVKRLSGKWKYSDAQKRVLRFDIQRTDELLNGWNDTEFGENEGLDKIVGDNSVDVIIGGPPCQAYSLAGRIRDIDGMKNDYRNYLFESYLKVVDRYKPKFFIFENVPGMLSAAPDGTLIIDEIKEKFEKSGYKITDDFKEATIDLTNYGIPQKRKRVIIFGVSIEHYKDKAAEILKYFYHQLLVKYISEKKTVKESIADLPSLYPSIKAYIADGKRFSHLHCDEKVSNHIPRFHSERDIGIFKMLASDIESGNNLYTSTEKLKTLYYDMTGYKANVHKYYVLRWNEQSNTIPAHLYKDGLRHIHPDSKQSRSLTVREAARLQTFPDDYVFIGGMMHQYKMIGNAVPPDFSYVIASAIKDTIDLFGLEG